jgi:hypothetical protein
MTHTHHCEYYENKKSVKTKSGWRQLLSHRAHYKYVIALKILSTVMSHGCNYAM